MDDRPFYCVPRMGRVSVWRKLTNNQRQEVATNLPETQAVALATTLNDQFAQLTEQLTVNRRQRSQLQSVGNMLFALVREVVVMDGPPLDIKASPAFPQRWHEAMELLLVLANEGIPTAPRDKPT